MPQRLHHAPTLRVCQHNAHRRVHMTVRGGSDPLDLILAGRLVARQHRLALEPSGMVSLFMSGFN